MSFPLKDGVAIVTGAASGIGASLADMLAARGCHLALADRDAAGLAMVATRARAAGVRVSEHVLDIADRDAVAALPERVLAGHGRATLLVNNAGVALGGRFDQVSLADMEWLFDINFWGVVRTTHAFLPHLKQAPEARIVNISSIFGIIAPAGQAAYAASKFAVRGFTESLRHELDVSCVGVTVVHPGGIATSIAKNARKGSGLSETEVRQGEKAFKRMLRLSPDKAAERIVEGIERREGRVLVGSDAAQAAWLQRLMPVRYWSLIKKRMRV